MGRTILTASALGLLGWGASTWIYATPSSFRLADAIASFFHLGEPRTAGFGTQIQVLGAAFSAFVGGLVSCLIPQHSLRWTVVLVAMVLVGTLSLVLAMYGRLFEPFTVMASLAITTLFGTLYAFTPWGSRATGLKATPSLQLAEDTIEAVVVTVTFANTVRLRADLNRAEYLKLCKLFSEATGPILIEHGGFLGQQSPEEVRAFFGLPNGASASDYQSAASASLNLRDALAQLREESDSDLLISIGLAAGPVAAGTFGQGEASYFGAVGPAIERSKNLCKVARRNRSLIACDSEIEEKTSAKFTFRPLELLEFGEDDLLTETFEILGQTDDLDNEVLARRELFWSGVIFLREHKKSEALQAFEACTPKDGTDLVLEEFKKRAREI